MGRHPKEGSLMKGLLSLGMRASALAATKGSQHSSLLKILDMYDPD